MHRSVNKVEHSLSLKRSRRGYWFCNFGSPCLSDVCLSDVNQQEKARMKDNHRSGPLVTSALHLLHRAGQCAEVLFTNETAKADLTPRQYAVLVCVGQNPDVSQTGRVEQPGDDRATPADGVPRLVTQGLVRR